MLLVTHDIDEAIYMSDPHHYPDAAGPARSNKSFPIALDRPRDRSSSDFLSLRSEILELLHFRRQSQVSGDRVTDWACSVSVNAGSKNSIFLVAGAQKVGNDSPQLLLKSAIRASPSRSRRSCIFFDNDELFAGGNVSYEPLYEMFRPARPGSIAGEKHSELSLFGVRPCRESGITTRR